MWIGANVDINKGAFVADNSIVGSNSVVTKRFEESNIILIGMPAKKIREAVTWSRNKYNIYEKEKTDSGDNSPSEYRSS